MPRTIVASASREVVIGFDQPFRVIGERINPTGRRQLSAELAAGRYDLVVGEALAQVAAGADLIGINVGLDPTDPDRTQPALMAGAVAGVEAAVDAPLVIDSGLPEVLAAGLEAAHGRPLLNSVSGEEDRLELLLPLVAKHGVPVVALCHEGSGRLGDVEARLAIARRIVERAADYGIARHDVIVDPLVMPGDPAGAASRETLELIRRLRQELGVNTICGLSNVSFGLEERSRANAVFLEAAIANGLTSAIMNPLAEAEMAVVGGGKV